MKLPTGALAAVVALSLAVWAFFYVSPGAPLTAAETTVVVGACAAAVFAARWLWGRLRGSRSKDGAQG